MLAYLPPVAQRVIGEHEGDHRLHHRRAANADTGVVAALRHDVGCFAVARDSGHRRQDRTRRLERDAQAHRLAG